MATTHNTAAACHAPLMISVWLPTMLVAATTVKNPTARPWCWKSAATAEQFRGGADDSASIELRGAAIAVSPTHSAGGTLAQPMCLKEPAMSLVTFLCSKAVHALGAGLGAWLIIHGLGLTTLGGLVMMMAGIVLAVTGLAGMCFSEKSANRWPPGHAAPSARSGHA
jgi:hypothetical protein